MQLKIEKGTFTNHSLEDIAIALKKGLSENFKNVAPRIRLGSQHGPELLSEIVKIAKTAAKARNLRD